VQIIDVDAGTVRNRVDLAGGLIRISARGDIEAAPKHSNRTNVYVQQAGIVLGEDRLSKVGWGERRKAGRYCTGHHYA
jgi:hypothetical protein